ncbi:MAG: endonuclease Q family protein [Planctomycetaceae bacterium]|nr:endonuclease Q family protein [Planctomycetaceae bacterium]
MRYVVDLHSHSGYAGGVGNISLETVADTMHKKGINAFGVGDCIQPAWREKYAARLEEREPGLFALREAAPNQEPARFVLQTEIIITSPVPSGGRKGTHVVLLFPSLAAVDAAIALLRSWGVKIDMGRPFVKCEDVGDVEDKCCALRRIDPAVMVIPAHVMTPQGIYGSDHPVDSLRDVFGQFADEISTVETGLSADPLLLALLPELDGKTLVSNSDCHSGALNRVGREFTALDIDTPSYDAIVAALRNRRIRYSAEFNPAEGRYFLTGHRAGLERHGASFCYYSPDQAPDDGLCPICGKKLTVGVLDRLLYISRVQSAPGETRHLATVKPAQPLKTLIPLVEVIAAGLGLKSVSGAKVCSIYDAVIGKIGTEADLWELSAQEIDTLLTAVVPERVVKAVLQVHEGDFSFQPGFDGQYGGLKLGEKVDWFGHCHVMNGA